MSECSWLYWPQQDETTIAFLAAKPLGPTSEDGVEIWLGGDQVAAAIYTFNHITDPDGTEISFHQRGNRDAVVLVSTQGFNSANNIHEYFQFNLSGTITARFPVGVDPAPIQGRISLRRGWIETVGAGADPLTVPRRGFLNFQQQLETTAAAEGYTFLTGGEDIFTLPDLPIQDGDYPISNEVPLGIPSVNYDHVILSTGSSTDAYMSASTGVLPISNQIGGFIRAPRAEGIGHNFYYTHPFLYRVNSFVSNTNPAAQDITVDKFQLTVGATEVTTALVESRTVSCTGFNDSSLQVIGALPRGF